MRASRIALLLALLALGACTSSGSSQPQSPAAGGTGPGGGSTGSPGGPGRTLPLAEALRACPVTLPNGSPPPGGGRDPSYFGAGGLWTVLWARGLIVVPPDDIGRDGTLGMKFPWWRGPGVRGYLHITGEEVGSGLPVRARTAGYGRTGFNASAIYFPTEGCYRVTGRAGEAELTFVNLVRTCSVLPEPSPALRRHHESLGCP